MIWSSDRYLKVFWLTKYVEHIVRLHYQSSGSAPDKNNKNENKE